MIKDTQTNNALAMNIDIHVAMTISTAEQKTSHKMHTVKEEKKKKKKWTR